MCYSDLSALYGAREINVDHWPYASVDNAVEYPAITGIVMWATGLLTNDPNGYRAYFDLNALLIALLFIAAALLLWRIRPEYSYLITFSPAVIGSLYINWDLWAVAGSLLSILFFKVKKYELSALTLGLAIATKFFPITMLLAVSIYFWRMKNVSKLVSYFSITFATWALINMPIAIANPDGWFRFYKLNIERSNDLGSIWYALDLLGIFSQSGSLISIGLLLIGILAITTLAIERFKNEDSFDSFAVVAFLAVALFVTVSKVYSPQYVLWLTPLALIAMRSKVQRSAFWLWQSGEAIYHLAIWQYLASYSGAKFGLPENLYALSILLRVATLAWFCASLIKAPAREPVSQTQSPQS